MNSEIWSLIADKGAPSWYITLSPVDNRHPLCLYLAGHDEKFVEIPLLNYKQRQRLIVNNSAAAACFFNFLVNLFIEEFLGCKGNRRTEGFYRKTNGYYGTVEQQGRLILHLHMMLWIKGALSPQEIHDRILDEGSDFKKKIIAWLEGSHSGDFFNGNKEDVWSAMDKMSDTKGYLDPTLRMPKPPPPSCVGTYDNCPKCEDIQLWDKSFKSEVDDLVVHSNVHDCEKYKKKDGSYNRKKKHTQAAKIINSRNAGHIFQGSCMT